MPSKLLSLVVFACLLAFVIGVGSVVADDKASLQGVWVLKSFEPEGNCEPACLVFKADSLVIRYKELKGEKSTYKIDATKSPKHLDLTRDGDTGLCIYNIKGDELTICMSETDFRRRPVKFPTQPDSGFILIVLKRKT